MLTCQRHCRWIIAKIFPPLTISDPIERNTRILSAEQRPSTSLLNAICTHSTAVHKIWLMTNDDRVVSPHRIDGTAPDHMTKLHIEYVAQFTHRHIIIIEFIAFRMLVTKLIRWWSSQTPINWLKILCFFFLSPFIWLCFKNQLSARRLQGLPDFR